MLGSRRAIGGLGSSRAHRPSDVLDPTASATAWAKPDSPVLFAIWARLGKEGLPTSGKRAHVPQRPKYVPAAAASLAPWRQRP